MKKIASLVVAAVIASSSVVSAQTLTPAPAPVVTGGAGAGGGAGLGLGALGGLGVAGGIFAGMTVLIIAGVATDSGSH